MAKKKNRPQKAPAPPKELVEESKVQPVGEKLLTVRIPADLHAGLVRIAKQEERTMSQTVRYMIRWYIDSRQRDMLIR